VVQGKGKEKKLKSQKLRRADSPDGRGKQEDWRSGGENISFSIPLQKSAGGRGMTWGVVHDIREGEDRIATVLKEGVRKIKG